MTDLSMTIAPKSDQLNADDLIAGPRTIKVTTVRGSDDPDQPVAIHFEGDNKKPYKPCKSMRRVMVHCWGADGSTYAGRLMTLYRDEAVMFGGIKVGGIRISHMSHIDRETTMALTATRAKRMPYSVKPLRQPDQGPPHAHRDDIRTEGPPAAGGDPPLTLDQRADAFLRRLATAQNTVKANAMWNAATQLRNDLDAKNPERLAEVEKAFTDKFTQLEDAEREG
jgi:hypothetical protein